MTTIPNPRRLGGRLNRLLASTAFAVSMALFCGPGAQAGNSSGIIKTLKSVGDDVVQGGVNAGKRLDNVIDDAVQGAAKGGRALDGVGDDIIDGGAGAVGKAPPPLDELLDDAGDAAAAVNAPKAPKAPDLGDYDDIDVIGKQIGDQPPKAPDLGNYDDIDIIGKQLDGQPPKAPDLGNYDDIDIIGKQLDGQPPKAANLDNYDDIDIIGKQLGDAADNSAPRYVDPTAPRTNYANPNDVIVPDPEDIYKQFIGIDDLTGVKKGTYANPNDVAIPEPDDIYKQFIGIDELTGVNKKAAALGDNLGGAAPAKPKKPPMTKLGGVKKTAVKAVRQLPVAPAVKAAAPAVTVAAARQATKGLSKTTKIVVGGVVGVTVAGIAAGTTYVLYETVEPVREGIDIAVTETGEGLNAIKDKVDQGFAAVGEFLHPGDPATITFYNEAGMAVEIHAVDAAGNEPPLAILTIEGERETVDVRIGDRLSIYKGGAPANEFYDVTNELNGSEIYIR